MKRTCKYIALPIIATLLGCAHLATAAGEAPPRPTPHERPRLPTQLNYATLQNILNTIEQPRVASTLKISYFGGRRSTQSLPIPEGFALLKAALEKEPVASKRWLLLQGVRGWAGFRNEEIGSDEGFAAYEAIFGQADKAKAAGAVYALQQAISEYVLSAVGRFRRLGLRDDERSGAVLAKAWLAYAEHQRSNGGKWIGAQPEWAKAFKRLTLPEAFGTRVEEVLADMGVPKTYGLLASAASVLEDDKPERAIELLQQARPLVPTDNPREATRFYGQLIALLRSQNKAQEAMAVQQEQIQRTGRGQAKLLDLQLQNKDEAGVTATLAALMQPHAPEAEINAAAAVLNSRWSMEKDLKVAALSEALLNSYLKASRTRTILAELEARWRLGWILLEQGKRAAAKSALDIATLKIDRARLDTNTPFILDNIKALQAKAETGK